MPTMRLNLKFLMVCVALGMIATAIYPPILSGFVPSKNGVSEQLTPLSLPMGTDDLALDTEFGDHTSYETFVLDDDDLVISEGDVVWEEYRFRQGDRLSTLWVRDWGLPQATLYRLLADRDDARILNRIRPGQLIEWRVDDEGYLTHLRIWANRTSGVEWAREAEGWDFARSEVTTRGEVSQMVITATIDRSVSEALSQFAELTPRSVAALAVLIDRHLPVRDRARSGDSFTLLVEQEILPGEREPLEFRLLAFEYNGQLIRVSAARHSNGRFYKPDGEGLLPPFDRRPFAGEYRLTSHFNLRRRHPVTGRVAPHYGTDWAMPIGTPILAPADGRVTRVETHPVAGRFIVIEHGQGYSTRYLHLSRSLVRPGQRVTRGERIALSGNTGRSTGPHLHYELHISGRPVNVMRAELPSSERLTGEELEQFKHSSSEMLAQVQQGREMGPIAMLPFAKQAM